MSINLDKDQLRVALEVPPYYELPASYVVFKDGTTVKAQNAHTGRIEFSGSDASTVIQSAINVAQDGDSVFIKNAEYTFTELVEIVDKDFFSLVSNGAKITNAHSSDYAFKWYASSKTFCMFNLMEGFRLYGNTANKGIFWQDHRGSVMNRLWLEDFYGGIDFNNSKYWSEENELSNIRIEDPYGYGIKFSGQIGHSSYDLLNMRNVFMNLRRGSSGAPIYGIYVGSVTHFTRGTWENVNFWFHGDHEYGIYIEDSTSGYSQLKYTTLKDLGFESFVSNPTEVVAIRLGTLYPVKLINPWIGAGGGGGAFSSKYLGDRSLIKAIWDDALASGDATKSATGTFVPWSGILATVQESDTEKHTLDLTQLLPNEKRNIVAVIVQMERTSGSGGLYFYPNEGGYAVGTGGSTTNAYFIVLKYGTNRLQYSQSVAGDAWTIKLLGYVVE
jgi:hypothetical protein